jgi:hypothetical protein
MCNGSKRVKLTTSKKPLFLGLISAIFLTFCVPVFAQETTLIDERLHDYNSHEKIVAGVIAANNSQWNVIAKDEYGQQGGSYLARINNLNPSWTPLIADPGIIQYLPDFEKWVSADLARKTLSIEEARSQFSNYLGFDVVYRGLALTDQEYKSVLAEGLFPRKFYSGFEGKGFSPFVLRFGISTDVNNQFQHSSHFTLSVSYDPLFALSLMDLPHYSAKPNRNKYLFKIKIPKTQILKHGELIRIENSTLQDKYDRKQFTVVQQGQLLPITLPMSSKIESFVLGGIQQTQLLSVMKVSPEIEKKNFHINHWTFASNGAKDMSQKSKEAFEELKPLFHETTLASQTVTAETARLPYRDLNRRVLEEFPKEYLIPVDKFNAEFAKDGQLYHGTDEVKKAGSITDSHFTESMDSYYGNGSFSSHNFQSVLRYTKPNGIVIEFKLKQNSNLRILNFLDYNHGLAKIYRGSEHYKKTFAEAQVAGMEFNDYLAEKYGIDVIINEDRIIIKNAAAIELPTGIIEIAKGYAEELGNRKLSREDRVERYRMLKRILSYVSSEISESFKSEINFPGIEKSFIDEISREGSTSEIANLNVIIKEAQVKNISTTEVPVSTFLTGAQLDGVIDVNKYSFVHRWNKENPNEKIEKFEQLKVVLNRTQVINFLRDYEALEILADQRDMLYKYLIENPPEQKRGFRDVGSWVVGHWRDYLKAIPNLLHSFSQISYNLDFVPGDRKHLFTEITSDRNRYAEQLKLVQSFYSIKHEQYLELGKTIETMDIPVRAKNVLKEQNIIFVLDLVQLYPDQLIKFKNFNHKSLNDVENGLQSLGLKLGMKIHPKMIESVGKSTSKPNKEDRTKSNRSTGKSGTIGAFGSAEFLTGNSEPMKSGEFGGVISNAVKAAAQDPTVRVGAKLGRETLYIATAKAASDIIVQMITSHNKSLKISDYLAHLDDEYVNMGLFSVGGGGVNTLVDYRLQRLTQIKTVNALYKANFADKMILNPRQQTMIKHQLGFFVGSLMIALKDAHKTPDMTVGDLVSNVAVGQVQFMAVQMGLQATSVAVAELITNSRRLEKIKQAKNLARGLRAASVGSGVPGWILFVANFAITEGVVMPMMESFAQKSQIIERLKNLDGVMDEVQAYLLEQPYKGKRNCRDETCYEALLMNAIKVNQDMNYFGMQKIFGEINVKQNEMENTLEPYNLAGEKEIKDRADPEYKTKTMGYAKDFTLQAKSYIQDYLKQPNDPSIEQAMKSFDYVLRCIDEAKKNEIKGPVKVENADVETYRISSCQNVESQLIEAEGKLAVAYETMQEYQATPKISLSPNVGLGDVGYKAGQYLGTNTSKSKMQQKMASVYSRLGKTAINQNSTTRLQLRNTLMSNVYFLLQDSVKNNVKPVEEFLLDLQAAQIQPKIRMGKGTYKQRVYVTISEQDNVTNAMDDLYLQYAYVNKCKNITTADQWLKTVFTKEDQERIRFAKEKLTKSRQAATQAAQPTASTELQYQWSGGAPTQTYKNLKPIEPLLPHETYKEDPKDLDQYPWITLAKIQTLKTDVVDKDGKSTQASIIRMDGQPLVQLLQTEKISPTTLNLYMSYITCQ